MESSLPSKSKIAFYRRLYVTYLIDNQVNTIPLIMAKTGMPRRTVQDTINSLSEMDIQCEFQGATKNGFYVISDWAAIKKSWTINNLQYIIDVLEM